MSYDIRFKTKVEGINAFVDVGYCDASTTWNVREMICKSTGLEWKNCKSNGLCIDVIPHIEHGLSELENRPEKYKKYNSPNGWGNVGSTILFFKDILAAWEDFQKSKPELVPITIFWIE